MTEQTTPEPEATEYPSDWTPRHLVRREEARERELAADAGLARVDQQLKGI